MMVEAVLQKHPLASFCCFFTLQLKLIVISKGIKIESWDWSQLTDRSKLFLLVTYSFFKSNELVPYKGIVELFLS